MQALHYAAREGRTGCIQVLLQHGANPNARNKGKLLLTHAFCAILLPTRHLENSFMQQICGHRYTGLHQMDRLLPCARSPRAAPISSPKTLVSFLLPLRPSQHYR